MSMNTRIHEAYDKVHAPEEVVERLKHEIISKNTSEDAEHEIFRVSRRSRPQISGYLVYFAAVFVLCIGGVTAWKSIQQYKNPIHPGMAVYTEAPTAERIAVPDAEGKIPDITNYHYEYAKKLLEQSGFSVMLCYEDSTELPAGTVIRTEPAAHTGAEPGSVVKLFVSRGSSEEAPQ